ncbi:hypothetical protein Tco_0595433 [Tanacetum coccineum]
MAYSSSSSNANSKVEAQLVAHQNNKLWYEEKIRFIKIDLDDKTDVLTYHKKLLAEAIKEKEELKTKLESFETSSKSLNTLLNSQLSANDKAGFRHNYAKESKVSKTITSVSKVKTSNSETSNDKVEMTKIKTVRMSEPIIEEWESDSEDDEIVVKPKEVTKIVKPSFEKIESVNARNKTVRQAENPRKNNKRPRVPQAVLTKSGLVSLNTAKSVSTAQPRKTMNGAMPTTYSYYKAYSSVKRPFNKKIANYNRYFNKRVNTVKSTRVNTARPKAEVNTVKASASWVWKPKHEELDHVFKSNSASKTLTRYDYVDALGRYSRKLGFFTNSKQKVQETQGVKKKNCGDKRLLVMLMVLLFNGSVVGFCNFDAATAGFCVLFVDKKKGFEAAVRFVTVYSKVVVCFMFKAVTKKYQGTQGFYEENLCLASTADEGQTANGKESSNPFMAGSLLKTIHLCDSLQSDKDSFELIELMILCTNFLTMGRIDDADAKVTFIDETSNYARNKNNKSSNSKRWKMTKKQL